MLTPRLPSPLQEAAERAHGVAGSRAREAVPLAALIRAACERVAPAWTLDAIVAVNPYLGWASLPFEQAAARLRHVIGTPMSMPRAFYREHVIDGSITHDDLDAALRERPLDDLDVEALRAHAMCDPQQRVLDAATACEAIDAMHGSAWAPCAVDHIARWCAAYDHAPQAGWPLPWRAMSRYAAWREASMLDRLPEVVGLHRFRDRARALPDEPIAAIADALARLEVPEGAIAGYFDRALATIGGWAAMLRRAGWTSGQVGTADDPLVHLLAMRLAWDVIVFEAHRDAACERRWRTALRAFAARPVLDRDDAIDLCLHAAFEHAQRRALTAALSAPTAPAETQRPEVDAVFCIDVRSEVLRRAFEASLPSARTHGFAGFFGLPLALTDEHGTQPQCPVLVAPTLPAHRVFSPDVLDRARRRTRIAQAIAAFKGGAAACVGFVEACGLTFAARLVAASFGWIRRTPSPAPVALDTGPLDARLALAAGILRAMSFVRGHGRLVVLCGHASRSTNNPFAASLQCGACGGRSGEANARIAAALLNDHDVRAGLVAQGFAIEPDVHFVAALHDTTTDHVTLFDVDAVPASHAALVAQVRAAFAQAAVRARVERAATLGVDPTLPPSVMQARFEQRARDWSQARPEWGLAGNAAFVIAPRARTRGCDLHGRAFLHDYDWRDDPDGTTLAAILDAPMVVASWINLQYAASTVDPARYGSGDKALHNVVAEGLGVVEGAGGDLRIGLPWQSVHDGQRFMHAPVRLNVYVDAPRALVDRALARCRSAGDLVKHGWVVLQAIDAAH